MPLCMILNLGFSLSDTPTNSLNVRNIAGKSFFDADASEDSKINPNDIPGNLTLPASALKNVIHSNDQSIINGVCTLKNTNKIKFDLNFAPNVGLPIAIKIKTLEKID